MVTLYYKEGSSDKVYQAWLEPKQDLFDVKFAYGRRGSTLTTGTKNSAPLAQAAAQAVMDKLVREKMAKGYTPGENGAVYKDTDKEDRFTGVLPMLLNPIEMIEADRYLRDSRWVAQEKFDGKRILLRKCMDGTIEAINRKGLLVGMPQVVIDEASLLPGYFILDGEMIGDIYYVFDILIESDLKVRLANLSELLKFSERWFIRGVYTAEGELAKSKLLAALIAEGKEGIVFKKLDAKYQPGRRSSGGNALKLKFYKTASVIVVEQSADCRSVFMGVNNEIGMLVNCGKVTIPPNHKMPNMGAIIEVRYLYAFRGGSLFQPVYLGPRDDIDERDCVVSQLKYKGEEDTE